MGELQWRTIEALKGHTLSDIKQEIDEIRFFRSDGKVVLMHHCQDCCESVTVEDVDGDMSDLIGSEILEAEEAWKDAGNACESGTWTFYKIGTAKGFVNIRWLGESNGYYGEEVDIDIIEP